MKLLDKVQERFKRLDREEMSLEDYLDKAKKDKAYYLNPAERLLRAIGEPKLINTSKDSQLSRIFAGRSIRTYPTFGDFYGLETVIDNIVSYLKHSAQGLEEKKQILYLLGAVGTAKSSLSERLKALMEKEPIFVLTAGGQMSPVYESPLGLFSKEDSKELGIPERRLNQHLSPWALKRLKEYEGDISRFTVSRVYPSQAYQIAISKTEPGDENNQDITSLVGKSDLRKLGKYSQNDPDAYMYSGGLNLANQGLLEFVEMFKAPIKVLHPLLTATQEGNYNGSEGLSSIPFEGIVLAHSNETEWDTFKNDKSNEAFIDRVYIIKVPYCLRISEEVKVYQKLINNSELVGKPCAPDTLELAATFSVLTSLEEVNNSDILIKAKVYDGQNIKEEDIKAKTYDEYKSSASVNEGMSGTSTRFMFKVLSKVFNFDQEEIAANPVHLFNVLETQIEQEQFDKDRTTKYKTFLNKYLRDPYKLKIEKEIQTAYLESYSEYGQNVFDNYIKMADAWIQDENYRDPDTGQMLLREDLEKDLIKVEKPAGIVNEKDFRNDVVTYVLRYRGNNNGENINWAAYTKMKNVIEKLIFKNMEDLIPIISFSTKEGSETQKKHQEFVDRMVKRGYTVKQVRLLVDWYLRMRKS